MNVKEDFPRIEEHDKPKSIKAWVDWNQKLTKWVVTTILVRRCEQVRIETVMHFIEIARVRSGLFLGWCWRCMRSLAARSVID